MDYKKLLDKYKMKDVLDPAPKPDAIPYDENAGTMMNVGRFALNNLVGDEGYGNMMPAVAGSVKAVKKAVELAPEGLAAVNKIAANNPAILNALKMKDINLLKKIMSELPEEANAIRAAEQMEPKKVFEQIAPKSGAALDAANAKVSTLDNLDHGMYTPEMKEALSEKDKALAAYEEFVKQQEAITGKQKFPGIINKITKPQP